MVSIEIEDPKKALEILRRLDVVDFSNADYTTDTACYQWIEAIKHKIEAAMLKEAENNWHRLDGFKTFILEINELGDLRTPFNYRIYPIGDDKTLTIVEDPFGEQHPIDPQYFVKREFNKEI